MVSCLVQGLQLASATSYITDFWTTECVFRSVLFPALTLVQPLDVQGARYLGHNRLARKHCTCTACMVHMRLTTDRLTTSLLGRWCVTLCRFASELLIVAAQLVTPRMTVRIPTAPSECLFKLTRNTQGPSQISATQLISLRFPGGSGRRSLASPSRLCLSNTSLLGASTPCVDVTSVSSTYLCLSSCACFLGPRSLSLSAGKWPLT